MFKKTNSSAKVDEVVSQSVNFELTIADVARRSERRAWWVAGSSVIVSLVLLGGYFYILPLKEKVPYLVMADAYTGTVAVARLTDDAALKRITASEAINRSNVAHFILARESYDIAFTNLHDWVTVLTMSSSGVAAAYTNLYSSQNPTNPYTIYGKSKAIRIRILSMTLADGGGGQPPKGATVRFERSIYDKQFGTTQPLDNKIATMAFVYNDNLKMSEQQRVENPLGFQVTEYRVDTDYASSAPAETPANPKPPEGDLPAMPGAMPPAGGTSVPGGAGPLGLPTTLTPQPPSLGGSGTPAPITPVAPSGADNKGRRRR